MKNFIFKFSNQWRGMFVIIILTWIFVSFNNYIESGSIKGAMFDSVTAILYWLAIFIPLTLVLYIIIRLMTPNEWKENPTNDPQIIKERQKVMFDGVSSFSKIFILIFKILIFLIILAITFSLVCFLIYYK